MKYIEGFNNIFENSLIAYIVIPILLLILSWILKAQYDKHFSIRPRLHLSLGNELYGQMFLGLYEGYNLTWHFECKLINHSKYDSYNVEIYEKKPKLIEKKIATNIEVIRKYFKEKTIIESNQYIEFELEKKIHVETDVLLRSSLEKDVKVYQFGLKIGNPSKELRPQELNNIVLLIKYENEKGRIFYTKFSRVKGNEINGYKLIKPMIFNRFV
jgi:hypothetical protein